MCPALMSPFLSISSALGEGKQEQALWGVVIASTTMLLPMQHYTLPTSTTSSRYHTFWRYFDCIITWQTYPLHHLNKREQRANISNCKHFTEVFVVIPSIKWKVQVLDPRFPAVNSQLNWLCCRFARVGKHVKIWSFEEHGLAMNFWNLSYVCL